MDIMIKIRQPFSTLSWLCEENDIDQKITFPESQNICSQTLIVISARNFFICVCVGEGGYCHYMYTKTVCDWFPDNSQQ